jgi:tetratricopeptide (TPR) repeat protein
VGGLSDKALTLYRRVIDLDPRNEDAHRYIGWAHMQLGEWDEVVADAEIYQTKFGGDPLECIKGRYYQNTGDLEKALLYRNECFKKTQGKDKLSLGVLYRKMGRPDKARQEWLEWLGGAKRGLAAYPNNPRSRAYIAKVHAFLGNREAVIIEETRLLAEYPNNPYLLGFLGDNRAILGDTDQAVDLYRQALRLGNVFGAVPGNEWYKESGLEQFVESPQFKEYLKEYNAVVDRLRAEY